MKSSTIYLSIIGLLLLVIVAGLYKFIIQGSTTMEDQRVVIHLNESEHLLVLSEMRNFLISVQKITQGIASDDMEVIMRAAKQSGNATQAGMPGSLVGKLPIEFKRMGFDTHSRFDQIALDAESFADKEHSLNQLAELMRNCIACHETYQFKTASN